MVRTAKCGRGAHSPRRKSCAAGNSSGVRGLVLRLVSPISLSLTCILRLRQHANKGRGEGELLETELSRWSSSLLFAFSVQGTPRRRQRFANEGSTESRKKVVGRAVEECGEKMAKSKEKRLWKSGPPSAASLGLARAIGRARVIGTTRGHSADRSCPPLPVTSTHLGLTFDQHA